MLQRDSRKLPIHVVWGIPKRREEPAAEVDVELIQDDGAWGPYLSMEATKKLDDVRDALKRRDLKAAAKLGRIYSLTPLAV